MCLERKMSKSTQKYRDIMPTNGCVGKWWHKDLENHEVIIQSNFRQFFDVFLSFNFINYVNVTPYNALVLMIED